MCSGQLAKLASSAVLFGVLAGCGGGGGGGSGGNPPLPPPPPPPTFTVGGTVTGLVGSVVLQNNGGGDLTVGSNGTFTFAGSASTSAAFAVTVLTQPGLQTCTVSNGSGSVRANVTNIAVACADVTPPTLALSFAKTKLFRFAWNSVASTTHYRLLEDANGNSGFTQVGADIPASATAIEQVTALHSRLNARYILRACGGTRCFDSNTVSVTGSLADAIGYFKASNPQIDAQFGTSIALSGDGTTMAVGAHGERSIATGIDGDQSDAGAERAGAVYVFVRAGNEWVQQAYVKASNTRQDPTQSGDGFGRVVALSADGSVLAVGATEEDSSARGVNGDQMNDNAPNSGAAYVFMRTGTVWNQQAYVKPSRNGNSVGGSYAFGRSVALSGDGRTLAVGATGDDSDLTGVNSPGASNTDMSDSGAVYVFARPDDVWLQQAYVKASNTSQADGFGLTLALSTDGSTLAISAIGEDSNATGANGDQFNDGAPESGAVFVFGRVGTTWSQQGYLKASNTQPEDLFGFAVALSADGETE
jgi:trimeric autotransporter adhesin